MLVKVLEQAEEEDFGMSTLGQVGIDIFTHLTCFFFVAVFLMEEGGTSLISNFQWRSWLWSTIEYPWTSSLAQFLACFSLFMVRLYGGDDGDGVGA